MIARIKILLVLSIFALIGARSIKPTAYEVDGDRILVGIDYVDNGEVVHSVTETFQLGLQPKDMKAIATGRADRFFTIKDKLDTAIENETVWSLPDNATPTE